MKYFPELPREDAERDNGQGIRYYRSWLQLRTGDINFVLDTTLENAFTGAGGVYDLIDVERLGIVGHSLGGSAALALPCQWGDIDAAIALEALYPYDIVGAGNNASAFTSDPYPVSVSNAYSDASWSHLSDWPQYARNYELRCKPQTTSFTRPLNGTGHLSLTDLSLASPLLVRLLDGGEFARHGAEYLQDLHRACLELLDRYLKHQGEHLHRRTTATVGTVFEAGFGQAAPFGEFIIQDHPGSRCLSSEETT